MIVGSAEELYHLSVPLIMMNGTTPGHRGNKLEWIEIENSGFLSYSHFTCRQSSDPSNRFAGLK